MIATHNVELTDITAGDSLEITRAITGIASGQTIAKAWLTIKRQFTDTDIQAVIQKSITSVSSSSGIISDTGADTIGSITFTLDPTETILLYPLSKYVYDIQVKLSGGGIFTYESGTITTYPQVTQVTT